MVAPRVPHAYIMRNPHAALALQILDVVDCTGSGDVDTSKVVSATDGKIEGVFGNRLAVNPEWQNPTGYPPAFQSQFHRGAVHVSSAPATMCSVLSNPEMRVMLVVNFIYISCEYFIWL